MHHITKTLLAAAVFAVSSAAIADSHESRMTLDDVKADPALADDATLTKQGVLFVNGLSDNIVAGYSRPQEKCDVFLCDKWRSIGEGGPISPGKGAIRARFHQTGDEANVICKYDLKIATQPADGSAEPMEHTFNDMDICMNGLTTRITFEEQDGKVHAVQTISDAEGNVTTVANVAD